MEARDERLDPVGRFTTQSLRLDQDQDQDQDRWREFASQEDNMAVFNRFFSGLEDSQLFLSQDPDLGLSVSLDFPHGSRLKVVCVSKAGREAVTKENCRDTLVLQEVRGQDVLDSVVHVTEQVTCPLLSNLDSSSEWVAGVADKALRAMEQQRNEVLVMKAQIQGHTFLPQPDQADQGTPEPDLKLLHACDWMIIEWAELVSEFLQQDSSQALVDGLKPLPAEEFHFWRNRLKNLLFIQNQLTSSRGQQVASIVQRTESVYWSTLRDIYRDVQEGVEEAQDVSEKLQPLEQQLQQVEQLQYQQLAQQMQCVLEEVRQVWTRSQFYCRPSRMVVLLQELCNLLIHRSREFLRGPAVLAGLGSDPGPVLEDVGLVMWTLQSFREAYSRTRAQLDLQNQSWNFPSHLVFIHLDQFLLRLQGLQEALSVSLQLRRLDQAVVAGASSMWTGLVQDLHQDFLRHVTVLSEWSRDPTDADDQDFQLQLDRFQLQVLDLERRLVSVLTAALETCSSSLSAAKLVSMFRSVLDRPLIRDQLRAQLARLVDLVLAELDQTEQLFCSHRHSPESLSRIGPATAAGLAWSRQLQLRAQDSMRNSQTFCQLCEDPVQAQLVQSRFQAVWKRLQDFRDTRSADWSAQLDSDCRLILDQPLIHVQQQGMLGVGSSSQLEAVLQQLRCVSRNTHTQLLPHAARLFTCRDDVTHTHLSLTQLVSCYNQVLNQDLQVELPLIQDQLQQLNQDLSELQSNSWGSEGVQQLVEQHRHTVQMFHSSVQEARANMEAMTRIIQGWAELELLQRSGDSLLQPGAAQSGAARLRDEGQELLRLTQVNRNLYGAAESSESWTRYLDHVDDRVQDGLRQMLLTALHFLSDNTHTQRCRAALLTVSLQLQETGSVFDPSVGGGLSVVMTTIISDIYTAAGLVPRISKGCHGNYQVLLQQNPELSAVEQEVMQHLRQVGEEAELLRAGLDRFSHLWQSDRQSVMQEFLTYSRQLGAEELEAEETPPTLKDFQREIELLHTLGREASHLEEVTVLHGWLQVHLQPFRDSLLSLISTWKTMYTDYLLTSVCDSLQQVSRAAGGDDSFPGSSFPLTESILLLEAAGVELPEHLAEQLQC